MILQKLEVKSFRNIDDFSLQPDPRINFIYGENGSGKSSLLESIYFLGTGKSFRSNKIDNVIKEGTHGFSIYALLKNEQERLTKVGIQRVNKNTQIKVNGRYITKASSLANQIPIQIIEPNLHHIITEGPEFRRRLLEWGVFHVEPFYESAWKTYSRNLAQRNAALKKNLPRKQLSEWDRSLVKSGVEIDTMRKRYIDKLSHSLNKYNELPELLESCMFEYYQGWSTDMSFEECVFKYADSDKERGFTQFGPHRADLRIKIGNKPVKEVLSRGQQKFLVSMLLIAQCRVVKEEYNKNVILLIDDFDSELDFKTQKLFFRTIQSSNCQAFITSIKNESLLHGCTDIPHALFHVEQGQVNKVI